MTGFAAILRQTDRGLRPVRVAEQLGLPVDVVTAALEHARAVGLVVPFSAGCSGCETDGPPPGCVGCPFASSGPARWAAAKTAPGRR